MVYSTCTFAPEENEAVVDYLLQQFPGVAEIVPVENSNGLTEFQQQKYHPSLAGARRLWPHRDFCEGFFAAKIRKLAKTISPVVPAGKRVARSPFQSVLEKRARELIAQIGKYFGCAVELPPGSALFQRDEELWLRPARVEKWAVKMNFERAGNRIAKLNREGQIIRLSHLGGSLLLPPDTRQALELSIEERDEFLAGRDFLPQIGDREQGAVEGQVALRHRGFYLGLGLLRDGKIKNQLPRDFIVLN